MLDTRQVVRDSGPVPLVFPDGKYLFFCGDDGNVYWVDAGVVGALRPATPTPQTAR